MSTVKGSDGNVGWTSEPASRGTWTILSSCLLTLVLCVYTALHMNVPFRGESWWKRRLRIAFWVMLGIFAPEIVVYTSWAQWSEARHLQRDIEKLRVQKGDEASKLLRTWSLTHSFYVVMGGIQLDLPNEDGAGCIKNQLRCQPSLQLTPTCILYLLRMDAPLPIITAQDLADRSKASDVAKFLSCTQALWLVLQIIGRAYSGLVVTGLEINTLAHVLCAFTMYRFWFSKPFLVEQPHRIQLESELGGILAYCNLFLSPERNISRSFLPHATFSFLVLDSETGWDRVSEGLWTAGDTLVIAFRDLINYEHRLIDQQIYSKLAAREGTDIPKVVALRQWEHDISNEDRLQYCTDYDPEYIWYNGWISGWDLHSWIRYWSDSETRPTLSTDQQDYEDFCDEFPHRSRDKPNTRFFSSRTNMLRSFHDHSEHDWIRASVMVLLSGAYSALHLTLWNATFPTPTEAWFWRAGSLVISICAAVLTITALTWLCDKMLTQEVIDLSTRISAPADEASRSIHVRIVRFLPKGSLLAIFGFIWYLCQGIIVIVSFASNLVIAIYIAARLFLVFESFACLRSQPPSAYRTPQWTQLLPHL